MWTEIDGLSTFRNEFVNMKCSEAWPVQRDARKTSFPHLTEESVVGLLAHSVSFKSQ